MKPLAKRVTLLGIIGNSLLFVLKVVVGFMYNSIAVISDAFNSLTDVVASSVVYISVKVSSKHADKEHPFGHYRAEPIAALIVAIFTGILGFEIINISISRFLSGERIIKGIAPIIVLLFTIFLKSGMFIYFRGVGRKLKSIAILASSVDHRNDVLLSSSALIGVGGAMIGYNFLDPLVAVIIGLWIIKSGYDIGATNIKYLIGEAPDKVLVEKIKRKALSVNGVKGIHGVKAHYVGVLLQIQAHITVDKKLSAIKAHNIGKKVSTKLESLEIVDKAFVHIDPI